MTNGSRARTRTRCHAKKGHLMARPFLGALTCESCPWIDVRQWHREARLCPGQQFSWSWTRDREPAGTITVRVESTAVVLNYRCDSSGSGEWKSMQQKVPIILTTCHLGGQRPWFVCSVYGNGSGFCNLTGEENGPNREGRVILRRYRRRSV
jgi:hypothetical protein